MNERNDLVIDTTRIAQFRNLPGSAVNRGNYFTNLIFNTPVVSSSFSILNNGSTTITSTFTASSNPSTVIAVSPYQIALFQTTYDGSTTNLIPGVNNAGWRIDGPFGMPLITPYYNSVTKNGVGTNGANVVFKTTVYNTTGSTQTVLYYISARVISFVSVT